MKKNLLLLLALICAVTTISAAGKKETTESVELRVSAFVGPSGIGMAPMFANPPQIKGVSSVTFEAAPSVDALIPKLIKGEIDIGILPPNVAAKLSAIHPGTLITGAITGNGMLSVVTNDDSFTGLADLAGKTVSVAGQGSTPEYVFRTLLALNNLESSVTLDFSLPTPEIAAALASGKIKYAVIPEPFATVAVMNGTKSGIAVRRGWSLVQGWKNAGLGDNFPMTLCVINNAYAKKNPNVVKAFLTEYKNSIEWVVMNPEEAGALVEQAGLGLKAPIATKAIPECNFVFIPAVEARPTIEGLLKVFLDFAPESIGGKLPDDSFYLK